MTQNFVHTLRAVGLVPTVATPEDFITKLYPGIVGDLLKMGLNYL